MKKHITKLLLLPLVAMAMLFSSCERDVHMHTSYVTVYPGDWRIDPGLGYYYCQVNHPDITTAVIDRGAVLVYFIDGYGFGNPLPYLLPYYLDYDNDGQGDEGPFFENIRYDLQPGKISFIVQENDLDIQFSAPQSPMTFKVCVMY